VYKSRPNVTARCRRARLQKPGNAVSSFAAAKKPRQNQALADILAAVPGVPAGAIELLDSEHARNRAGTHHRRSGLVDVVIPRGGPGLISHVMENAIVPVIETGAWNCHIFVTNPADLEMASRIVINAEKPASFGLQRGKRNSWLHSSIATTFIADGPPTDQRRRGSPEATPKTCRLSPT